MARRGITALLLVTLLSAGGCYDSHFSEAAGGAAAGEGNTPLSELRARYTGSPTPVEEDIRVVGYVTTSDRAGNFYRTLCIEQAGAALEVMVGLDHLHNDYPPGSRLMVRLRGLTLGLQYGVLQAGTRAEPGSGYATGYLGSRPAADAAIVRLDGGQSVEPTLLHISELTPERCGTLVRIEALQLRPDDGEPAPETWSGYHTFADASGRTLCTKASVTLTRDIRLRCVVTANDHYGEFDRTLVVADASGGIEVAVDAADLYRDYPLGANLTLYCNGLALGDYGGKIQLGAPPRGDYAVDRIPARELSRYLRCNDSGTLQRDFVRRSISEISLRDVDTYVRFDQVRFTTQGTWCDIDPLSGKRLTTERTIVDSTGATFRVRTLGSAHYAGEPLPKGKGSLCGIVDYFNGEYALRVTNYEFFGFTP